MLAEAVSIRSTQKQARLFAPRWHSRLMLLLWLALLAGCLAPTQSPGDSDLPLKAWFPDNPGAQQLALAAELGRLDDIRRLMQQENVDPDTVFSTPDGLPLLAIPILAKQPESLRTMLELGADPNARYPLPRVQTYKDGSVARRFENNAMVWAAKQADSTYLKLLLDHDGDPNTRNSNNETLLFQAAINGNQWQNVQLLVERGADMNEPRAGYGGPIIAHYSGFGGFQSVYWLLERGADPSVKATDYPKGPKRSHTLDSIFWHPGNPTDPRWQRKCQQWALAHDYPRPPMPEHYQRMRKNLGFEAREEKIPLL